MGAVKGTGVEGVEGGVGKGRGEVGQRREEVEKEKEVEKGDDNIRISWIGEVGRGKVRGNKAGIELVAAIKEVMNQLIQ